MCDSSLKCYAYIPTNSWHQRTSGFWVIVQDILVMICPLEISSVMIYTHVAFQGPLLRQFWKLEQNKVDLMKPNLNNPRSSERQVIISAFGFVITMWNSIPNPVIWALLCAKIINCGCKKLDFQFIILYTMIITVQSRILAFICPNFAWMVLHTSNNVAGLIWHESSCGYKYRLGISLMP